MITWPVIVGLICVSVLITCDVVTGIVKAVATQTFSSSEMRNGLLHKVAWIVAVGVAMVLDWAQRSIDLGFTIPLTIPVVVYIIFAEVGSVLENLVAINPELGEGPLLGLFRGRNDQH